MKYTLFFSLLFIAAVNSQAQTDSTKQPATIYLIRATGHAGSLINFRAIMDDVNLCKLKNNRYAVVKAKPGVHKFYVTSWDAPSVNEKLGLEIPLEAGQTYYLRMIHKQRFFKNEMYFEEITQNSAAPLLAKYKEDTECD